MQSLLRWGIENSNPEELGAAQAAPQQKDIDPGIIDMILGKPDAVLMKEDMEVAVNPTSSEDDRIAALDHLEMLIEQIDNANDLEKLGLWKPLNDLLTSKSSTPEVKLQALWVIGTALQNNPAAQDSYMKLDPLSTLMSFLIPAPGSALKTRSRALYAISGILKHNAPAVQALSEPNTCGWDRLKESLQDPEISVRRKAIFLINSLLIPTSSVQNNNLSTESTAVHTPDATVHPNSHAVHLSNPNRASTSQLTLVAVEKHNLLDTVLSSLVHPLPYGEDGDEAGPDQEYEEKGVQLLYTYGVVCKGPFSSSQKSTLSSWLEKEEKGTSQAQLAEKWGITSSELKELRQRVE